MSLNLIKALRERTGAGLGDCKKAIEKSGGDLKQAEKFLAEILGEKALKKSNNIAANGLVGFAIDGHNGVLVEINSETDFASSTKDFISFVENVTNLALKVADVAELLQCKFEETNVAEALKQLSGKLGENIALRRMEKLTAKNGLVVGYAHLGKSPKVANKAVLVALESEGETENKDLMELAQNLCFHVISTHADFLTIDLVPQEILEEKTAAFTKEANEKGNLKPEVVANIVKGKMQKNFFQEQVLMEQVFSLADNGETIGQMLQDISKKIGKKITIGGFKTFICGEGIEKKEDNFAEEVAKQVAESKRKD